MSVEPKKQPRLPSKDATKSQLAQRERRIKHRRIVAKKPKERPSSSKKIKLSQPKKQLSLPMNKEEHENIKHLSLPLHLDKEQKIKPVHRISTHGIENESSFHNAQSRRSSYHNAQEEFARHKTPSPRKVFIPLPPPPREERGIPRRLRGVRKAWVIPASKENDNAKTPKANNVKPSKSSRTWIDFLSGKKVHPVHS